MNRPRPRSSEPGSHSKDGLFATVMGWFVAKGRAYPSLVACIVGATVGITLGSLVVPTGGDRVTADADLVTTHTVGTPSSEPSSTSTEGWTGGPTARTPSGTGTPRESADDDEGRTETDGAQTEQGEDDEPRQSGPDDEADADTGGDTGRNDDTPDEPADAPKEDDSRDTTPSDEDKDDTPPPSSSQDPDDRDPTDAPEEPEEPDESDEPDEPDEPEKPEKSEEPDDPEESPPPTLDTDFPEPAPTDPDEREEYCLGLDLSLLELLICLG